MSAPGGEEAGGGKKARAQNMDGSPAAPMETLQGVEARLGKDAINSLSFPFHDDDDDCSLNPET